MFVKITEYDRGRGFWYDELKMKNHTFEVEYMNAKNAYHPQGRYDLLVNGFNDQAFEEIDKVPYEDGVSDCKSYNYRGCWIDVRDVEIAQPTNKSVAGRLMTINDQE